MFVDYVQQVVESWKKMAEETIATRRRRLAEIDTNINLLKNVREETVREIARTEGLLNNLIPLSNELAAAARKEVDSVPVTPENGFSALGEVLNSEVRWQPQRSSESGS